MRPLAWDMMRVPERFRLLRQFDFSDLPGSPAEWAEMMWEQLPSEIRIVLKQIEG